jgi:carbon-monoxide dehydrogenase medium subunit
MKPAPFAYHAPDSLDGALTLAHEHGYDAKWLAGGQSLVPAMNFRLVQPAVLIDLNPLSELSFIRRTPEGALRIGSMTRQRTVERDPTIMAECPLLAAAIPHVAHPQIRNRGTIGGSMVHADPASELPVIAVTLGARFYVRSLAGERWITADDFFQGIFTVDLSPEEMLVEIEFPRWPEGTGWSFLEMARRHGDYALVGVAALVALDGERRCREARLVFLNVGDQPVVAASAANSLVGRPMTEEVIAAAARHAADAEIDPLPDVHASVAYQRHLARVLAERALREATARAVTGVNVGGGA